MDARLPFTRPAVLLGLVSAFGAWLVTCHDIQVFTCLAGLIFALAVAGLCKRKDYWVKGLLLILPVWYAVLFLIVICPQARLAVLLDGKTQWLEGRVVSFTNPCRESGVHQSVVLRLDSRIRIRVPLDCSNLAYDDRIRIHARLTLPAGAGNPGGFNELSWTSGQGVLLTAESSGSMPPKVIASGCRWSPLYAIWRMRTYFYRIYLDLVGREHADMLAAFLFGDRSGLSDDTESDFRKTGLTHILSVSGSHLSLVASPVQALIGSTGLGKKKKLVFLIAFLFFFSAATGFQPSIVRAMLMMIAAQSGKSWKRLPDAPSGLGACVAFMLCVDPWLSCNMGFLISVAATAGIVCLKQPISERLAILPRGLRSSVSVALSAQLGSLPILITSFRRISLLGLPVGLIVMPFIGVLLPAGLLLGVLGRTFASGVLAGTVSFLLRLIMVIVSMAASIRGSYPIVPFWTPLAGLALWLGLGAIASRGRRVRIFLITASAGLFIVFCFQCFASYLFRPDLTVIFADVGQGDCTLIKARDGTSVLIDFGTKKAGADAVLPLLAHMGINRLDFGIVTHGHADHAGGFQEVSEVSAVNVLMIPETSTRTYMHDEEGDITPELIVAAVTGETDVVQLRAGDYLEIDPQTRLDVLHPPGGTASGNEASLCLLLSCGGFSILMMGDAGLPSEQILANADLLKDVDILRVAHHGSDSASGEGFLGLVNPEVSIISVGRNVYGHPAQAVLNRLENHGSVVYRSDRDGAVTIRIKNGILSLDTFVGGSLR